MNRTISSIEGKGIISHATHAAAIINLKSEPMIIVCALLAEEFLKKQIPVVDGLNQNPMKIIKMGDKLRVNGNTGEVEILP